MAVPTVPTISVSDEADGTATVAVTTSSVGSTNAVFYQAYSGFTGTGTWASGGSRTGDGNITVSGLSAGFYWFYLTSTLDGNVKASSPYKVKITNGEDAVYKQIIDSVHSTVSGLGLTGVSTDNILICKMPSLDDESFISSLPAILITPGAESFPGTGTTKSADIIYEVPIAVFAQDAKDQTSNLERYLKWREEIRRAFHNKTLTGISSSFAVQHEAVIDPLFSFDPAAWQEAGIWFSPLMLRVKMREQKS